jgi:hypothetical protein
MVTKPTERLAIPTMGRRKKDFLRITLQKRRNGATKRTTRRSIISRMIVRNLPRGRDYCLRFSLQRLLFSPDPHKIGLEYVR